MGTTRIKVIDLSSSKGEIKTARKHAEKLSELENLKKGDKKTKNTLAVEPEAVTTELNAEQTSPVENPQEIEKTSGPKPKVNKKNTHPRGKKYLNAKDIVQDKNYSIAEALELLEKTSYAKFDPTVEIHLTVSDKNLKGSVKFPHLESKQKENKYLIFSDQKIETKKSVIWGSEKTIGEIENSDLKPGRDFDVVLTTPKFMPTLAKVAKILGPKGLMPNPKNGTITENIEKFLEGGTGFSEYKFKTDPSGPVLHTPLGKLSQKKEDLKANLDALISVIGASKIKSATLSSTMSPGIKVQI